MNWIDYVVIAFIVVFAFVGFAKGFLMSVYKVVSFFICIFASIKFYPVLAGMLDKTPVYNGIKNSIMKTLMLRGQEVTASSTSTVSGAAGANAVISPLPLPDFFKRSMLEKLPSPSKLLDIQSITNAIGDELTRMVISVISLILLYILLRIVLSFVGLILKGVSKLPVFKQIDRMGGFIIGAIQGFLAVFIVCAVLVLFNSNQAFVPVFSALDGSVLAGWFYENNFIISAIH